MATATEKDTKTAADLIRVGDKAPVEKSPSQWSIVWKRFSKNKLATYGFFIILIVVVLAVFAPVITQLRPGDIFPLLEEWEYGGGGANEIPNLRYIVGTDTLGRDTFARIIWGAQVSLTVGLIASLISTVIGVGLGILAGYYRGLTEEIIMRITDMFLAVPFLLIAIVAVSFLRSGRLELLQNLSHATIMISVLGLFGWARIVPFNNSRSKTCYDFRICSSSNLPWCK